NNSDIAWTADIGQHILGTRTLSDEGYLEIKDNGNVLWQMPPASQIHYTTTIKQALATLLPQGTSMGSAPKYPGFSLIPNQYIESPNKQFAAYFMHGGVLILYELVPNTLHLQTPRNLIMPQILNTSPYIFKYTPSGIQILSGNNIAWQSGPTNSTAMQLNDYGVLVLYNGSTPALYVK
ncbi:MAG: hypothetical protein ACYCPT_12180, partial [Acidimicrobiales bacterium]